MSLLFRKLLYVWFFVRWGKLKNFSLSSFAAGLDGLLETAFAMGFIFLAWLGNWPIFGLVFLLRLIILTPFAFVLKEEPSLQLSTSKN